MTKDLEMREMARNLLRSLTMKASIEASYMNYHVRGLHYLNLFRSERLNVKLYFFTTDIVKNDLGMIIWPHDHAFGFHNIMLSGSIAQHYYRIAEGSDMFMFVNHSKLREGDGLQTMTRCSLRDVLQDSFNGYVEASNIHSLELLSEEAVSLQIQYHDQPGRRKTLMFATTEEPSCTEFTQMNPVVWRQYVDRAKSLLNVRG